MIPLMHAAYGLAQWAEAFRPGRDFSEPRPPAAHAFIHMSQSAIFYRLQSPFMGSYQSWKASWQSWNWTDKTFEPETSRYRYGER